MVLRFGPAGAGFFMGRNGRPTTFGTGGMPGYYLEYLMPIDWKTVAGVTPSIAMDFVSDRYDGASLADIATVRASNHAYKDAAGNTLTFGANAVRRSNLGLFWTTDDSMTIGGALASLISGSQGWLAVEIGVSEVVKSTYDIISGPNNAAFIGCSSGRTLIGRGGNGVIQSNYNGSATISANSTGVGNGKNLDSYGQMAVLTWDASGNRKICVGGGAVVAGSGGTGATGTVYIGRHSGGAAGTGILRSIRAGTSYLSDAEMQTISFYLPTIQTEINVGDSKAGGSGVADASATSWWAKCAFVPNPRRPVFAAGVGGQTVPQIEDRFFNRTAGAQSISETRYYDNAVFTYFLGHNGTSAADTLAGLKRMIARQGGEKRFLIVLPTISTGSAIGSADYIRITDMRALILATFPAERIIDEWAIFQAAYPADSNNASGWNANSTLADAIHDNQTGQDLLSAAIYNRKVQLGWFGVGGACPAWAA